MCKKVKNQSDETNYPSSLDSNPKRSLYDNLENNEELALALDDSIINNKPDGWKTNKIKKRTVYLAIKKTLKKFKINDDKLLKEILELAIEQNEY